MLVGYILKRRSGMEIPRIFFSLYYFSWQAEEVDEQDSVSHFAQIKNQPHARTQAQNPNLE